MNLLPLPSFLSCPACGALLPQAKGPRRRVSTIRYVCDCECRRDYFEKLAGFPLYSDVLLANTGHIGTVKISRNDSDVVGGESHMGTVKDKMEAAGAPGGPDYREHLDGIVGEIADAMNPQGMPGGPFA